MHGDTKMKYSSPECEVLTFSKDDVITASGGTQTPVIPFSADDDCEEMPGGWV